MLRCRLMRDDASREAFVANARCPSALPSCLLAQRLSEHIIFKVSDPRNSSVMAIAIWNVGNRMYICDLP